jgi:hypothetical protein
MADGLVAVRNKTGEERYIPSLGEAGYPVNRTVGDDETVDLPAELADLLAEQPGWELVGDLPKKTRAAAAAKE